MQSKAMALKRFTNLTVEEVWRHITASLTEEGVESHGSLGQNWLPGTYLGKSVRRYSETGDISVGDIYSGPSASGRSIYYITVMKFDQNRSFAFRESHWNPLETHGEDPSAKHFTIMDFDVVERDGFVDVTVRRSELIQFRITAISSIASWAAGRLEFIIGSNTFGQYGKNKSRVVNGYKIMRA